MRVHFLEASNGLLLGKTFLSTPEGLEVRSYPTKIKRLSTRSHDVEKITELAPLIQDHATKGHAMLKGTNKNLALFNESRKGKIDSNEFSRLVVLDFDKVTLHPDETDPRSVAECAIQTMLPKEFQDVSYIVQASSSFGVKPGNQYSFHLFFLNNNGLNPASLCRYFQSLNFENNALRDQISLSNAKVALHYPLDPTVGQNSRIIYIATPKFEGLDDPLPKVEDRIVLVTKKTDTLDIQKKVEKVTDSSVKRKSRNLLQELRNEANLPEKFETRGIKTGVGETTSVLVNPEGIKFTMAYDEGDYIRGNVNGGDSNAYWFKKSDPRVVKNFKGEPAFLLEQADPEFYKWYREAYDDDIDTDVDIQITAFRDTFTDKFHKLTYNSYSNEVIEISQEIAKQNLEDALANDNALVPSPIPDYAVFFNPTQPHEFDRVNRTINTFVPIGIIHQEKHVSIPDDLKNLEYGQGYMVGEICPNIHKLIFHVVGSSQPEFEHFFNWLCLMLRKNQCTRIAWVLHGTTGTGKGFLFHKILTPLLGHTYTQIKKQEDIEEQFNSFMENTLLLLLDEVSFPATKGSVKTMNKLKSAITEPYLTVRKMRTDQIKKPNYCNFLFYSNQTQILKIDKDDRRFNFGLRQETPLFVAHPELQAWIDNEDAVLEEVQKFAAFVKNFRYSETRAQTILNNHARCQQIDASSTWIEDFALAVKFGDLEFFVEHVLMHNQGHNTNPIALATAKRIVKYWLLNEGKKMKVDVQSLRLVFNLISDSHRDMSNIAFTKTLNRMSVDVGRVRINGIRQAGVAIEWKPFEDDIAKKKLFNTIFTKEEMAKFAKGEAMQPMASDELVKQTSE